MIGHYVGQRVTVNAPYCENHGKETVIIKLSVPIYCNSGVTVVGHAVALKLPPGEWGKGFAYEAHELIPITDRPALVEWADCAWSPHRAGVKP